MHFIHKWERKYEYIKTDPIPPIKVDEFFSLPGYAPRTIAIIEYKVCKICGKKKKVVEDLFTGRGIISNRNGRLEKW